MVGADKKGPLMAGRAATQAATRTRANDGSGPEWAFGLKRLYDEVVDEPIPDSFMALLSKLDESGR